MDNNSINLDELCSMTSKSNPLILAFSENNVFRYYVISKFKKVEFAIDCYRYESDIEMAFAIEQGSIIEHTFNDFYAYMPSDLVKMDFIKEIPSHHFSLIEEFLKKKHSESEERLGYFQELIIKKL